jgi:hypothetical protein
MSDLIERLRKNEAGEMDHQCSACGDAADRIEELEWLVAYVINGLNDWSDGHISYDVFFTEAAANRVRRMI